jgi:pimeloyl-ACP methyl ester carboxylesterase
VTPDADILRVPVGPGFLHAERYGQGGAPVILLHGFGTSSFLWRAVGPLLGAEGCTAYAIDLLGYGESDRPYDADFSVAAQAEYLDQAMIALRISRAVVAGVDVGGGVALRLAATRPERVAELGLINSIAFDEWPGEDAKSIQLGTARFALRVARGMLGVAPLLTPILERSVANPGFMPQRLVARYLAPYVGTDGVMHLLALARALDPDDLAELDLSAVLAPTLIVRGEEDPWVAPSVAERLAAGIAESRLVRLPQVARLVPEEAPELLAGLLLELAGLRPQGSTPLPVALPMDPGIEAVAEAPSAEGGAPDR